MLTETNIKTAKFIPAQAGETFGMLGVQVTPKATAEETGGAFTLMLQVVSPGGGSPPHILHSADKVIYVLEGQFAILLDKETQNATAGDCAIIPMGVIHNFKNVGSETGKILVITSPAGHEGFLRDLSRLAQSGGMNPETMAATGKDHHVEILPPKKA